MNYFPPPLSSVVFFDHRIRLPIAIGMAEKVVAKVHGRFYNLPESSDPGPSNKKERSQRHQIQNLRHIIWNMEF